MTFEWLGVSRASAEPGVLKPVGLNCCMRCSICGVVRLLLPISRLLISSLLRGVELYRSSGAFIKRCFTFRMCVMEWMLFDDVPLLLLLFGLLLIAGSFSGCCCCCDEEDVDLCVLSIASSFAFVAFVADDDGEADEDEATAATDASKRFGDVPVADAWLPTMGSVSFRLVSSSRSARDLDK